MMVSKRLTIIALIVTASIAGLAVRASDREPAAAEPGFLEVGKDYMIVFPDDRNIFMKKTSGVTTATYTTEDGEAESRPASWSMTLKVETFKVVALSRGQWVLLEHPRNLDDIPTWNAQRRALAILQDSKPLTAKANDKAAEKRQALHEAADTKVPTSQTWVNLNHALAIAPPPTEEETGKLTVNSITVSPNNGQ